VFPCVITLVFVFAMAHSGYASSVPSNGLTESCNVDKLYTVCGAELASVVDCSICVSQHMSPDCVDVVGLCREAVTARADPQDPPFDMTKVLFSGIFSTHGVLQRAPRRSSVYGTATPGATVTVVLSGPDGYSHTSAPTAVTSSPDSAVNGTWKILLPARTAGFGYTLEARCLGCPNTTAHTLTDIGFGDVFLCSGQSNMEDPVLTTVSRNESYAQAAAGKYDHIRLFQVGWRFERKASTWILPQKPDDGQGYPQQSWRLPRGCPDHHSTPSCSLQRFSALCWYFGKSLSDLAKKRSNFGNYGRPGSSGCAYRYDSFIRRRHDDPAMDAAFDHWELNVLQQQLRVCRAAGPKKTGSA